MERDWPYLWATDLFAPDFMASSLLASLPAGSMLRVARRLRVLRDFSALAVLTLGAGTLVRADTYSVDRTDDTTASECSAAASDCTLRGALTAANAHAGNDTIAFDATVFGSAQTISVSSDMPTVDDNVSIVGPGAKLLTVREAGTRRFIDLFFISNGVSASFSGLTIGYGNSAIYNGASSAANITSCVLSDNLTGLYNDGEARVTGSLFSRNAFGLSNSNSATLKVMSSTVSSSGDTGLSNDGIAIVANSTFFGNSNTGLYSYNTLRVTNCTVSGNGTGLVNDNGTAVVRNSLLVGNSSSNASSDVTASGNNIVTGTATRAGLQTSDGQNAVVLKDNGGLTPTIALVAAGTAFDAGDNSFALDVDGNALATDQRGTGFPRAFNGTTDIGAFELQNNDAPVFSGALKIAELRLKGPGGDTDEYIELSNPLKRPVLLSDWTLVAGSTTIPLAGTIPACGRFLVTNSGGYSLGNVVAGDLTYTDDIPVTATLTLKDGDGSEIDAVGNLAAIALPTTTRQYAYVRRLDKGAPADTNTDSADFNLVDVGSTASMSAASGVTSTLTGARLGAPGPRNANSPIQRNTQIALKPTTDILSDAKYPSVGTYLDKYGRLTLRRKFTNNTGAAISQLRFRLTAITAGASTTSGISDLRVLSSGGGTAGTVKLLPLTMELPSVPVESSKTFGTNPPATGSGNGGGLGTTLSVALPNGTLANGASVNVEFNFGINADGRYRIVVDAEMLP